MLGKHINHCEDSLTSAVFSHLFHLPVELWWPILHNASYSDNLPLTPGEPLEVMPWPSWDAKDTRNSHRVVPDLFLRFTEFDLIIEAKRWDHQQQKRSQWEDQFRAYLTEYQEDNKVIRLMALGGLWTKEDEEIRLGDRVCLAHMVQWCRVLNECQSLRADLLDQRYPSSQSRAHVRTLDDIVELMAWHGYQEVAWFSRFALDSRRPTIIASGGLPVLRR